MITDLLGEIAENRLQWLEPIGLGFFDCDAALASQGRSLAAVYDQAYFDAYRDLADQPIGTALNTFRCELALKWAMATGATILDVGIGDGAFLRAMSDVAPGMRLRGVDVNPAAIAYLDEQGWCGTLELQYDVVTFWDSLEHFRDPRVPLRAVGRVALVSLPIFTDAADAVTSKHFKPEEHFWYFTRHAFRAFAEQEGFDVLDILATESALGRESIETFVLWRKDS